jgi:type I restriction-modification system DNA methylase subunit/restriction endonuclease S subunit
MTDFENFSLDELIEYCKTNDVSYLNAKKKPYAKSTLIRNIKNSKLINKDMTERNIVADENEDVLNEEIIEINEIVWTLENNGDTNTNYKQIKDKLHRVVNNCHKILYSSHSVVGTKAQNDIMKILTIRILQPQFQNVDSELYKKCKKLLDNEDIPQEKFDKYMSYCIDLKNIRDAENPVNEWVLFIKQFLMKIFKDGIYNEEDSTFSFGKEEKTLMKLIENVCELEIDKEFIDAFSTSFGDIHEAFRVYNSGKGSKELGQFFTPRPLIHTVLHGCGLNDIIKSYENPSIYDCCMGTGGLLARTYSNGNITPNNIHGCETEKDTIKFGQCSLLLTTNEFNSNIIKCNSLCENPFIGTKKFDIIFTNPPFGTSMNYKEIEKKFNENKNNLGNESGVNFKDVYPIVTNNGACLFTQHCIYMLEDNGTCAIVLPDGELFTGNKFKKFREYMCEKVNIIKIINVSGKAFEHTAIKTAVIIFQKNGSTKNIEFMDIPYNCNSVKKLMVIPINNIKNNNYNLSYSAYIKKEERQYNDGIVVKTLGEVCSIDIGGTPSRDNNDYYDNGNNLWASIRDLKGGYIYDTKEKITDLGVKKSNVKLFAKDTILFSFKLSIGKTAIVGNQLYTNEAIAGILSINENLLSNMYLYYYLTINDFSKLGSGMFAKGSLNKKSLGELKIPIPSLVRQQEIVEECKQITKSIDTIKLRKEQLKSDGILFKKYYKHNELNEIYKNSEAKTLGEVCDIKCGNHSTKKCKFIEGEYLIIGGGKQPIGKHNEYNCDENTILCASHGTAGYISMYPVKTFLTMAFAFIENKQLINKIYLYYYLKSIEQHLISLGKGTAQPCISMDKLKSIKIPIPSLENQEIIIAYYEQMTDEYKKHILDKIEEHNKELEMLKELCVNMFSL